MTDQRAGSPRSRATRSGAGGDLSDFIVVLHRHETRLPEYELAELRRWIHSWRDDRCPTYVVVGCCADTSRADRQRRLHGLLEQLELCGVVRDMIRYTDEWLAPAAQSAGGALPQDVVWLKAVDAARAGPEVTSIRGRPLADGRIESGPITARPA